MSRLAVVVAYLLLVIAAAPADETMPRCYLMGNSLTWDTVPGWMGNRVQWHVDCGVNLPHIFAQPEKPCVKESTVWPTALRDTQYDVISVQPFYGSTVMQDAETISAWMKLQPKATFVLHTGWAWHAQRASEFASYAAPDQMTHSPGYFRALASELLRRHPGRKLRQTFAQNLLAQVAEDIASKRAPWKDVAELYRDGIHMTHDEGKYLMHNAMRRALGLPFSATGFEKLATERKAYLDGVLAMLVVAPTDKTLLVQVLSSDESQDRAALIAKIGDRELQAKVAVFLPEIERAIRRRRDTIALEAEVNAASGRLICTPSAPQWLYLATGDQGTEVFDIPAAIDLYNGNNPLKGKGGRNEIVNDDWLKRIAGIATLKKLDLANCAIRGEGLRHVGTLSGLRELNLTLTPVTDEHLQHLGGLSELRVLGLASSQCNGTGFVHLKSLKNLENVNFHFTPLNDAGLEAISQVPISGRLWFAHTKFTDAGAAHLSRLTQLKRCGIGSADKGSSGEAVAALSKLPLEDLALLDNQANATGIAHAAKIATLKRLDVSHAPTVKDDSLPHVAQMPNLEEFKLGGAQLSDDGLQALAASKSLKKLTLSGVKGLTPMGLERLRQARPEWKIEAN